MRYQRISLLLRDEAEWRLRSEQVSKEGWKSLVLEQLGTELARVLKVIAAAPPGPLLFHCVAGKDRTGVLAAVLLTLADVEPGAIARDYAISAQNLREGYLKRYSDTEPARILEALRCPEEGSHRMFAFLKEAGGIRAYLAGIGLTADADRPAARTAARLRSGAAAAQLPRVHSLIVQPAGAILPIAPV